MAEPKDSRSGCLEQLRQKRREMIAKKDWATALEILNQIVVIEPTSDNFNQRGMLLFQMKRYPEALASFENARTLTPDSPQTLDGIAKTQAALKNASGSFSYSKCLTETTANDGELLEATKVRQEIRTSHLPGSGKKRKPGEESDVPTVLLLPKDDEDARPETTTVMETGEQTATLHDVPPPENIPHHVGRYPIRKQLGKGGMGKVFQAYDPELKRDVALKTMLAFEDEQMLKRFIQEAEMMAKLSHPYIVKVYDIGNTDGIPYFAMEFVEGRTLAQCLQQEKIPVRRVAEMMRKVAEAIHYAHRHGILHRDMKPSNIMVDNQGEPKVMDFGLAMNASSDSKLSQSGVAIGTPAYMPPEQALGKRRALDERSDVYSLGAVLYESLTGVAPFHGTTSQIILKQVIERDPVPPSQIAPRVPKELENICLTAMAKDKQHRYSSAQEFAEDLERFLSHERVLASAPSRFYKFSKWFHQNRLLGGVTVSLGLLFIVVSFLFYHKIQVKEREINDAKVKAQEAEAKSKEVEHKAIQAAEEYRMLQAAEERKARRAQEERAKASEELQRAKEELAGKIPSRLSGKLSPAEKVYMQGLKYCKMGRLVEAEAAMQKVIELSPKFVPALNDLGVIYYRKGRVAEAINSWEKALALNPKSPTTYMNLGSAYFHEGRDAEAIATLRKALELDPKSSRVRVCLGNLYKQQKKLTEAREEYTAAIRLNPENYDGYNGLGAISMLQGNLDEAVKSFCQAIKIYPDGEEAHNNLGCVYLEQGKITEAAAKFETALQLRPNYAVAHKNLADTYAQLGKVAEAVKQCCQAIDLKPNFAEAHFSLGKCYTKQGEFAKAISAWKTYLELAPTAPNAGEVERDIQQLLKKTMPK